MLIKYIIKYKDDKNNIQTVITTSENAVKLFISDLKKNNNITEITVTTEEANSLSL